MCSQQLLYRSASGDCCLHSDVVLPLATVCCKVFTLCCFTHWRPGKYSWSLERELTASVLMTGKIISSHTHCSRLFQKWIKLFYLFIFILFTFYYCAVDVFVYCSHSPLSFPVFSQHCRSPWCWTVAVIRCRCLVNAKATYICLPMLRRRWVSFCIHDCWL